MDDRSTMRWSGFAILAFVVLVLQVGVGRVLGLGPQRVMPDLLLLVAVILSMRGRAAGTLPACWGLGLIKDLTSQAPLGSYALAFGILAWAVTLIRDLFYGDNPLVLITITFLFGFLAEEIVLAIGVIKGDFRTDSFAVLGWAIIFSCLFTAGLAPYGQAIMMKFHRNLALSQQRRYKQL